MYRLPRVQGITRRLPSMENDIRHVTAFLSAFAITIRLGPTDVILGKQSANRSFRPSSPRFSSRFRHFANFNLNTARNRLARTSPVIERNRTPRLAAVASSYYGCLRFQSSPFFFLFFDCKSVDEASHLLENLSSEMFSKEWVET